MPERKRATYIKREILLNEQTIERIEEQAHERGVTFHTVAEAMLEDVLGELERDKKEQHPLIAEFFERPLLHVHDEMQGAISQADRPQVGRV